MAQSEALSRNLRMAQEIDSHGVEWASLVRGPPPFAAGGRGRQTAAHRRGLRYERAVLSHFGRLHPGHFLPSPWIQYRLERDGSLLWCQPDGLLFDPRAGRLWVVEVKLKHTAGAAFQLGVIYSAVLAAIFPPRLWSLRLLEVVRWYDPATSFPGRHRLTRDIRHIKSGEIGVLIWKPKGG